MDRMAARADNIGLCVFRRCDIRARQTFRVTFEAGRRNLFGRELRIRANRLLSTVRRDVFSARSVAAFAAGVFRRFFPRRDRFEVRITKE